MTELQEKKERLGQLKFAAKSLEGSGFTLALKSLNDEIASLEKEISSEKNSLPEPIQHLAEKIEEKDFIIKVGLEEQGHIETIERILDKFGSSKDTWEKIGNHINYDADVACYEYVDYLRKK